MLEMLERSIGGTGLSVGTHLAMESLFSDIEVFDPERERPPLIDLNLYSCYYINLYTLTRNLLNSFPNTVDRKKVLGDKQFPNYLANEIYNIKEMFNSYNIGHKVIVFKCDYSKAIKAYNNAKGELEVIPWLEYVMIDNVLNNLLKKNENIKKMVTKSDHRLPKPPKGIIGNNFLVTTSIAFDLLNKGNITLLETHTGKTKEKDQFYTKFHKLGEQNLASIPFAEETLYIMGDRLLVKPLLITVRRKLLELANSRQWTYKTNMNGIRSEILGDTLISQYIHNLRKVY